MAPHASILAWRTLWTEAWWATVHGVAKSWTRLKRLSTHARHMPKPQLSQPQPPGPL